MRADYQEFFILLKECLIKYKFEFIVIKETELTAELLMPSKWVLEFDCEKYYGPSFTISICPPKNIRSKSKSYAVWILMKIFEKINGKNYGLPTFDNQIKFLRGEGDSIFNDPISFEAEYEYFNQNP